MKKTGVMILAMLLMILLMACGQGGGTLSEQEFVMDPPDPAEDYTAFYEYLVEVQAMGKIPYEDKLTEGGEVTDPFALTIGGKPFTNAEAESLTVYTATFEQFTKVEGHTNTWVGYRFTEVCELLGLELDQSIKLHATDGYSQVFDVKNIDDNTMIAIAKDADPSDGPYFAPCTYLISSGYTKYLSEISIL